MMNIRIAAIEYYLPSEIIHNQFFVDSLGFDAEFIENKLGIKERRRASSKESCHTLAHKAVKKLLEMHSVPPESVRLVITVTQNPDYKLPNVTPLLQDSLGFESNIAGIDLNLGCSGFVYGLAVAKGLMEMNGLDRGIIVTSDPYSKIIDPDDRTTSTLFGDAAAAVLIDSCEDEYIGKFDFGTDGSKAEALIVRSGGSRHPNQTADVHDNYLFMDGRAIFTFMMKTVPKSFDRCLKSNDLTADDIDYYVFHQASGHMLQSLMKHMNIPREKMVYALSNCGNTVSSSIPIALKSLMRDRANLGQRAFLSGFGVGLSWASAIIRI